VVIMVVAEAMFSLEFDMVLERGETSVLERFS